MRFLGIFKNPKMLNSNSSIIFDFALCLLYILAISHKAVGCGDADCPVDCEHKYECVDHSELCSEMEAECENFFFRKCMRCACPKTCGVCGEHAEKMPTNSSTTTTQSTSTTPTATTNSSSSTTTSSSSSTSPTSTRSSSSTSSTPSTSSSSTASTTTTEAEIRYASARLEVCDCNLWRHPEIEAFVHSLEGSAQSVSSSAVLAGRNASRKWAQQVSVDWIPGVAPRLVFLDANGTEASARTLVANWTWDELAAYLDENLVPLKKQSGNHKSNNSPAAVGNRINKTSNDDDLGLTMGKAPPSQVKKAAHKQTGKSAAVKRKNE